MIPGGGYSEVCGGQTIADGSRFRTGGGILWNILKSREPKAYKEIMAKGKELEVLFYHYEGISYVYDAYTTKITTKTGTKSFSPRQAGVGYR